jgi:hypothetical protein
MPELRELRLAGALGGYEQPAVRAFEAPLRASAVTEQLGLESLLAVRAHDLGKIVRSRGFGHLGQRTRRPRRRRAEALLRPVLVRLGPGRVEDRPAVAAAFRIAGIPRPSVAQVELDGLLDETLGSRSALGRRLLHALGEWVGEFDLGHSGRTVAPVQRDPCATRRAEASGAIRRKQEEPSSGLEPETPSLPWRCSTN